MVFSSNIFLFAFLPLFLACYYLTPWRAKSALILSFSWAFYAWWRPDFLALLAGVTGVSYAFALSIGASSEQASRHRLLTAGVTWNLLALGYFKYANFGIDSVNVALNAMGFNAMEFTRVLGPLPGHQSGWRCAHVRGHAGPAPRRFQSPGCLAGDARSVDGPGVWVGAGLCHALA